MGMTRRLPYLLAVLCSMALAACSGEGPLQIIRPDKIEQIQPIAVEHSTDENADGSVIKPVSETQPPSPPIDVPPPSETPETPAPPPSAATPPAVGGAGSDPVTLPSSSIPAAPTPPSIPGVGVSATVSALEPIAEITVTNTSGHPTLQGCLSQKNELFTQNTDGTSFYRTQCALQKSTTIIVNAPGAPAAPPTAETIQINFADPRVTLAAQGGTCDEPSAGPVDVDDPATCEFTGKVNLAPQVAYDYEILENGTLLTKGTASWTATLKFFAKRTPVVLQGGAKPQLSGRVAVFLEDNEVEAQTSGNFFQVDRDHDHTVFTAGITGLDGTAVLSNELHFPYVSSFGIDPASKSAASSWLEHINRVFVHVHGEINWHARHIQRLNYVCTSANVLNLANLSSDNISTNPGSFRSAKYTEQMDGFSVESIFPISSDQNRITNPCWGEQVECRFTALGYDGKTYQGGTFTWDAASSLSQCGK